MFNKFDFKYIIKRVIIGLAIAFILFNINKCNAHAMIIEKSQFTLGGWVQNQKNGYVTPSTGQGVPYTTQNDVWFNLNNEFYASPDYDYVGFKIWLDVYSGSLGQEYCTTYNVTYNNGNISQISCQAGGSNGFDKTFDVNIIANNSDNETIHCFLSHDIDNIVLCPTGHKYKDIAFHLSSTYNRYEYRIQMTNFGIYYNNESTEIVNGLGGVQQQQQQTNTIITDPSTTQSTTSGQNFITNGQSAISNKFEQATSYNQFMGILNNFLGQMSNATCQPINLPIPYTQETLVLPCLGNEFTQRIPALWTLYKLIITGALGIVLWKYFIGFIKSIMDPYNIGATNLPIGGGK